MTRQPASPGRSCAGEHEFVSREWVDGHVDAWIASPEPVLVLSGPPGTGKTELARHLARARPEVAYAHFCRAADDATLEPGRFVEKLVEALAVGVPGYAARLERPELSPAPPKVEGRATVQVVHEGGIAAGVFMPITLDEISARPAFDRLVRRPLEALTSAEPPSSPVVVIVDGLDEAVLFRSSETLVHLLQAIASPRPPAPLRLLLTSRRDRRVFDRIRGLRLDLLDDAPVGSDDLRRYAERRLEGLGTHRRGALAERVASAAEGNFLYARYVIDELTADAEHPQDPGRIALPPDLNAYYHGNLQRELRRTDEAWEERYRPLLGLLVIARGAGLSRELLVGASGIAGSRVDDALRRMGQYLEAPAPEGPFRIYHQSFRDFLATDADYGVYPDEAEDRLAEHLCAVTPTSPDGRRDWTRSPSYTRAHLAGHAAAAARLDRLLEDPGFLITADPQSLTRAVPAAVTPAARRAKRIYGQVAHLLRDASPGERAAYLEMAARQNGSAAFADAVVQRSPDRPWSVPWAHWRRAADHFVAGRHEGQVFALAVGELDGQPVIVSGGYDLTVRVWALADGTPVVGPIPAVHAVLALAVGSLDGRAVVVCGGHFDSIWIVDLADGTAVGRPLTGHDGAVDALAVHDIRGFPVVVSAGQDRTVRLWRLSDGKPLGHPFAADGVVTALAVGELDGRPVIVTGSHAKMRVWRLDDDGSLEFRFTGEDHAVSELPASEFDGSRTVSPDGEVSALAIGTLDGRPVIVSGGDDGGVRVSRLADGSPVCKPIAAHLDGVTAVAVGDPDGRPVIVSGGLDGIIRVWDARDGTPLGERLVGHDSAVTGLAMAEMAARVAIVSASLDGTVRVWELPDDGSVPDPVASRDDATTAVALGELEGRHVIICGGHDETLQIRDLVTGSLLGTIITSHHGWLRAVAIAELDGRQVVISGAGGDATLQRFELADGSAIGKPLRGHEGLGLNAMTVGELDERPVVISGGQDGTVRFWDPGQGAELGDPLICDQGAVTALVVDELEGRTVIVTGGSDGTLRLFDLADRSALGDSMEGHLGPVNAVAVSELGGRRVVVSGGRDETIRVWDPADGRPILFPLYGHDGPVSAVVAGYIGRRPVVISGGEDGVVTTWDLATQQARTIRVGAGIAALALAGAEHIVIGAEGGTMVLALPRCFE